MKKIFAILVLVGLIIGGGYVGYSMDWNTVPSVDVSGADPRNTFYEIEGQRVALVNGRAETDAAPGSASKTVTTYFGNEATGDLNGDGRPDVALLLTQTGGGSGTFYYIAVAVNTEGGYKGTNAILLGDRVHPQPTEIRNGQIIANYGDRKPGQSMTAEMTFGVSKYLKFENGVLVEVPGPYAKLDYKWEFEVIGEKEFGAPITKVRLSASGKTHDVGTFDLSCSEQAIPEIDTDQLSRVICWWAGGGTEIGIFGGPETYVVKQGDVDEGTAEEGGFRGNFKTILTL